MNAISDATCMKAAIVLQSQFLADQWQHGGIGKMNKGRRKGHGRGRNRSHRRRW
jgi:hypothetical protein